MRFRRRHVSSSFSSGLFHLVENREPNHFPDANVVQMGINDLTSFESRSLSYARNMLPRVRWSNCG